MSMRQQPENVGGRFRIYLRDCHLTLNIFEGITPPADAPGERGSNADRERKSGCCRADG